ncbi:hypothetical protein E4U16_001026, partial [Claviceps sp. LM84 group G4]
NHAQQQQLALGLDGSDVLQFQDSQRVPSPDPTASWPARPRTGIPSLRTASRVEPGASLPAPSPKTPPSPPQQRHKQSTPIPVLVLLVQRLLVCLFLFWCLNSPFVASKSLATGGRWEGRSTQALRKKLFYEIAVFVLGCGNPFIVLLFWPGWLIVGGLAFVLWRYFV